MTGISDELLVAHVDGELDAAQAGAVERALAGDEDLRRRAQILRATAGWMREAFPGGAQTAAPLAPAAVTPKAPRRATWRTAPWAMPMAASLAAFAVGLGGGYVGAGYDLGGQKQISKSDSIIDEMVDYYRIYRLDVPHLVERPAADRAVINGWMTGRFRRQLLVPDLDAHGMQFQGARVMALAAEDNGALDGFQSQSAMILVYRTLDREIVSLIVSTAVELANSDPVASHRFGKNVFTWVHGGVRFTLVAGIDPSLMAATLPELRRQLNGPLGSG